MQQDCHVRRQYSYIYPSLYIKTIDSAGLAWYNKLSKILQNR
jgi:hypothetical protein